MSTKPPSAFEKLFQKAEIDTSKIISNLPLMMLKRDYSPLLKAINPHKIFNAFFETDSKEFCAKLSQEIEETTQNYTITINTNQTPQKQKLIIIIEQNNPQQPLLEELP